MKQPRGAVQRPERWRVWVISEDGTELHQMVVRCTLEEFDQRFAQGPIADRVFKLQRESIL